MYTYAAEVIKVVDGDTVDVDIDLGFGTWQRGIRLRLNRIDAYETRLGKNTTEEEKAKGLEAKQWVKDILEEYEGDITITTTSRGKYGRWIAEVMAGDVNINDALVDLGYAVYREY